MRKFTFLYLIFFVKHIMAYEVLTITNSPAFNYFASLNLWLLLISAPVFLVIVLLKYARRVFS
jgi:hypothetical protein